MVLVFSSHLTWHRVCWSRGWGVLGRLTLLLELGWRKWESSHRRQARAGHRPSMGIVCPVICRVRTPSVVMPSLLTRGVWCVQGHSRSLFTSQLTFRLRFSHLPSPVPSEHLSPFCSFWVSSLFHFLVPHPLLCWPLLRASLCSFPWAGSCLPFVLSVREF